MKLAVQMKFLSQDFHLINPEQSIVVEMDSRQEHAGMTTLVVGM